MQTKTLLVTPMMARDLLTKNPRNRALRRSNVRYLANELKSGRWMLTHQGVAVATDGTLLDGQHRLHAIVEANTSALINVSFDCPPEMFTVIDTGSTRTSADVLRTAGAVHRNETTVAAAARIVYLYRNLPNYAWTGEMSRISAGMVLEEYQRASELYSWAIRLANRARTELVALNVKSAVTAFVVIASEAGEKVNLFDRYEVEAFVMSIANGANMAKGDPRWAFRQQLINGWAPDAKGARASQAWLASLIKVFNLHLSGAQLKMFKTPTVVPMPKILA